MDNPSLLEEPRRRRASVIPQGRDETILEWLQRSGRLIPRDEVERSTSEEREEEIADLIVSDDSSYDGDDDDDEMMEDDD